MPTHLSQTFLLFLVPLLITLDFRYPEISVCLWNLTTSRVFHFTQFNVMPMPEASIYKYARPVLLQYKVRMSRQPFVIQSVSESTFPQPSSHNQLRLRVFRPYCRHIIMTLLCCKTIHNYFGFLYAKVILIIRNAKRKEHKRKIPCDYSADIHYNINIFLHFFRFFLVFKKIIFIFASKTSNL